MPHRREHLESSLQRLIAGVISEGLGDPRVRGMISVTRVQIADEGRVANVYVSVLPEAYESRSLHGLRSSSGHIRNVVGDRLRIRTVPRLEFELDRTLKKQAEVLRAIREAAEQSAEGGGTGGEQTGAADGAPTDGHED